MVSRAEARFIVHQNRLAIVIRSVSPSEITVVSLIQLDRLSREEQSGRSGSVVLIRAVVPMISRFVTEKRAPRPVKVDRLSKDDPMAEAFAGLSLREREKERERENDRKTSPTSRTRGEGGVDDMRRVHIVNNYSSPRNNNGRESFSLMRVASPHLETRRLAERS